MILETILGFVSSVMSMTFEYPYGDAPRAHAAARRPTPACPPDSSVLMTYERPRETKGSICSTCPWSFQKTLPTIRICGLGRRDWMSLTSRITRPSGPNEELLGGAPKLPGCPAYKRVPSLLALTSWGRPSPVNVQLRSHLALYGSVTSIIGRMPPTPRNCWPM